MFDWLLGTGLVRTQVMKFVANIAAKGGVLAAGWLVVTLAQHGYSVDAAMSQHITAVGAGITGLIVAVGQLVYDVIVDPRRVDTALKVTAQAQQVVPPPIAAMVAGQTVTLSSGKQQVIGKPSLAGQTDAQERTETADLMKAELAKIAVSR